MSSDEDVRNASFLRPQMNGLRATSGMSALPSDSGDGNPPMQHHTSLNGERQEEEDDDDDDNDDDERPREMPRPRPPMGNPFPSSATTRGVAAAPPIRPPARQPNAPPFAQAPPPQAAMPPLPAEETLRVSPKCAAKHCFRVQWEAEMNPRCREKTALNVENTIYLFDGFYILCHDDTPDVPQFEYTRGGVMCRIRFIREPLPQALLPPPDDTLLLLNRYIFQQLLGIQSQHLFQTVFGDPTRASGDPSDFCSDFHLIPRFISLSDAPLVNKGDLVAPHRIGFAVGKFLRIDHVLGCLDATSKCPVPVFLETNPAALLVDSVVSTRVNGVPGVFRVDELVYESVGAESHQPQQQQPRAPQPKPRLVALKHCGEGALAFDGVTNKKKMKKWEEMGKIMQISPQIHKHVELLNVNECHLTGLRVDLFELGSAMPMVLKYMRHYKLLASFEADMKLHFKDKTLLRQAFTHGSYVDAAMQSVNTVEATISRVRVGHIFENVNFLKRKRAAFLDDQSGSGGHHNNQMDPEVKRMADQHLTSDFQPQFHSKFLCPYERLEFLGDAVLSFLVASSSFLKLPHSSGEGMLHETRKEITNNDALGRVARDANFDMLMLTAYDLKKLPEKTTSKIAADCMEALLGAVFSDQGIDACRALLIELMNRHDPNVRELYLLDTNEMQESASAYVALDRDRFTQWSQAHEMRLTHRRFTKVTNTVVVVKQTHLWLQALTHPSFKHPQIENGVFLCTDPNYERIEFLGDAVLQLLSSSFLVDAFPHHQEHLLTQARSSLVKNTRLAQVAKQIGYEQFVRLGNQVKKNGHLYTDDVLADVFEASLGAVFLENARDLQKVRNILEIVLFPLLKDAIQRREWMNPEKVLTHHLVRWGKRDSIKCEFKKIASRTEHEHCIALYINKFCVSRASGRTIHEAKNEACRRALHLYGLGLHAPGA